MNQQQDFRQITLCLSLPYLAGSLVERPLFALKIYGSVDPIMSGKF